MWRAKYRANWRNSCLLHKCSAHAIEAPPLMGKHIGLGLPATSLFQAQSLLSSLGSTASTRTKVCKPLQQAKGLAADHHHTS